MREQVSCPGRALREGIWQLSGYRLKSWEQNRVKKKRECRLSGTRRTCRCLKQRQEEKGKERGIQAAAAFREVVGNPEDCCIRNSGERQLGKGADGVSHTLMRADG